ncbi:MAG: YaiO family outer membrane beta-barrel protein, partial [Candidatus Cloacimonadales bacterium]|nr:YaiO family outer membrane beta-barrel protein [Candidatus Cloacimonadales bacterium]
MKQKTALLLIIVLAFTATVWSEVFLNRIEPSIQYEYLDPDSLYGAWSAVNVTYFREVNPYFNYHLGATAHYRNDAALLLYGGIFKTLSRKLFTNLAISGATKCDYLQKYRFDADINLKIFRSEALIATLGYAYVNYHNVHEDIIWRYGLSVYITRFIFQFMIFDNTSKPGDIKSSMNLFSIGYGIEGWQWTYLTFNFG